MESALDTPPEERHSALRLALELAFPAEWAWGLVRARRIALRHDGRGRPVLVLPGFLIADFATIQLRRRLAIAGYRPYGWGLGLSAGATPDILERIGLRLREVAREAGRPVALVGWSLGGLYAREVAKRAPELVERVITLGSPFSGDLRLNNAWRTYELIAGHPVDQPPLDIDLPVKPPVPTIAIWSCRDGVIPPAGARGLDHEADLRIMARCSHTGMGCAPSALAAVLKALAWRAPA